MKMARASQADVDAALEVTRMLGDLEKRTMPDVDPENPSDDTEWFDRDDAEHCKRAMAMLLDAASKGSLFRVTFGMLVVLDPRNELLDPNANTLEKHPKTIAAIKAANQAEFQEALRVQNDPKATAEQREAAKQTAQAYMDALKS